MTVFLALLKAFLIGGLICVVGQLLIDLTKLTPGKILVLFVVSGVVLGAVGVYGKLVRFAGCGATIPLVGFGYNLVVGTKTAVQQQGLMGVLTGPLCSASAGVMAAILSGLLVALFAKPKEK